MKVFIIILLWFCGTCADALDEEGDMYTPYQCSTDTECMEMHGGNGDPE